MRHAMIVAALVGAALVSGAAVRAQEWGGAAGVAAMRGYTASPGVAVTSYVGGPAPAAPADAEALAAPPGALGPAPAVAGLAGDVPTRGRSAAVRTAKAGHGNVRRRPKRA